MRGFRILIRLMPILALTMTAHPLFSGVPDSGVKLENVKMRLIESNAFKRISEYFTGKENTGNRVILRSDPEQRGGLYFIVRTSDSLRDLPAGLTVTVEYFETGSPMPKEANWKLPDPIKDTNKLFLGMTDAPLDAQSLPVAWRIRLLHSDGTLYHELKSYLWELPERSS